MPSVGDETLFRLISCFTAHSMGLTHGRSVYVCYGKTSTEAISPKAPTEGRMSIIKEEPGEEAVIFRVFTKYRHSETQDRCSGRHDKALPTKRYDCIIMQKPDIGSKRHHFHYDSDPFVN